ncbi:hypothetical protein BU25DRAFT_274442 [Macroventuria anomochaeta]|uniref:Uncharacterized protein n=1 Tax=Macroventuria anomochaeta TaxID=301207 RepID=A0ACB6S758_9PLEO|nr:uncharacterized protein BU25DRAFT_274442 [Macroventuria anomochaeta]KAF2629803.1 hypothetical protein BU25DRAFT_274442 [Macroventuria anomochaeta]
MLLLFTSIYTGVATFSGFRYTAWPSFQYLCLPTPPAIWFGAFFLSLYYNRITA